MKFFFKIWKKINTFFFIVVILLGGGYGASMIWLGIDSAYQDEIFQTIVDKTVTDTMTDIEKIQSLVEITHRLMGPPRKTFLLPPEEGRGFKDKKLHSADVALMGGYACYMHAQVAGMLLQKAGFDFRFYSMTKDGNGHHVGQVLYNGKYIAFDALFNQMFVKPNGEYASVKEVHDDWEYYKQQVGNKLLFKDYDKPFYYPTDFYRKYYDFTPAWDQSYSNPKKTWLASLLGFSDNYRLNVQTQLDRYLYYKIDLTKKYLKLLLIFGLNMAIYLISKRMSSRYREN